MKLKSLFIAILATALCLFSFGLSFAEEAAPAKTEAAATPPEAKSQAPWPASVDDVVKKAKASIKTIDMEAFKKVVENKGDAVIIDVREPDEYKAGHVPGAINIPRGLAEFKIWKAVAGFPDKTNTGIKIYTYCKIGGRSILTAKALQDVGFTDVTGVDMKMDDWVKAGYPVER